MSDSKLTPPPGNAAMSVRECRLILERLLVAAGAAPGEVPAVRDVLLTAEIHGLGVLDMLHREGLHATDAKPRYNEEGVTVTVDGAGRLSAFLVPGLRDLILEKAGRPVGIRVTGTLKPELLRVLAVLPELEGLRVEVEVAGETTARLACSAASAKDRDTAVKDKPAAAHRDGLPVPGKVWLDLYRRSNRALLEESALTRRHAGYQDVDEDGRIVRPMDDDVDVELAMASLTGQSS